MNFAINFNKIDKSLFHSIISQQLFCDFVIECSDRVVIFEDLTGLV